MVMRSCELCGDENPKHWKRCAACYKCDDCDTRDGLCMYVEGVLCDTCHAARVQKRIAEFSGETQYTSECVCPHCGYTKSDSWEMTEGEQLCDDCEQPFEMSRYTEVTYCTSKA